MWFGYKANIYSEVHTLTVLYFLIGLFSLVQAYYGEPIIFTVGFDSLLFLMKTLL